MWTPRRRALLLMGFTALFAIVLMRNAWVGDDAYITLRTVHNALEGHGLRFNVGERVQAFTHPLWMMALFLAHGLTGEPFFSTIALGFTVTLSAVVLTALHARSHGAALLCLAWWVSVKSFMDYGTSGLENPLTHLLLLATWWSVQRSGHRPQDLLRTTVMVSLALTNRLDSALLVLPLLALHTHRLRHKFTRFHLVFLTGFLPLALWEGFSVVYYGSFVPNTAAAKLGHGLSRTDLWLQGMRYVASSIYVDPFTTVALGLTVVGLFDRRADNRALFAGVILHALYVISIGGDFMLGRLWTPAVFAVGLRIADARLTTNTGLAASVCVLVLGALSPWAPIRSGLGYETAPSNWEIADERGFYHRGGHLFSKEPGLHYFAKAGQKARREGKKLVERRAIGYFSYHAGPDVHVLDPLALTDPLLARLPARYTPNWRIGHFNRAIPRGYDPSTGKAPNDPGLHDLHAWVQRQTRGPLLDVSRWFSTSPVVPAAIWSRYRFAGGRGVPELSAERVRPEGLVMRLKRGEQACLEGEVYPGTRWRLVYLDDRQTIVKVIDFDGHEGLLTLPCAPPETDTLRLYPHDRLRARSFGRLVDTSR